MAKKTGSQMSGRGRKIETRIRKGRKGRAPREESLWHVNSAFLFMLTVF
jgi:hypothetical protein